MIGSILAETGTTPHTLESRQNPAAPLPIDVVELGDRYVFRNQISGAIVLSDRRGLDVLKVLQTPTRSDPEPEFLDLLHREWSAAGLLDKQPSDKPVVREQIFEFQAEFSKAGRRVNVIANCPRVFGEVATMLSAYRVRASSEIDSEIVVERTGNTYVVYDNGRAIFRPGTIDEARFLALQTAIATLAGRSQTSAVLHAGLVAKDGVGVLIAGGSGAGKTTLVLDLVRDGWEFGGDDLIAVTGDRGAVATVPCLANVKSDSHLDTCGEIGALGCWLERRGGFVDVKARLSSPGSVQIGCVLFPKFGSGKPATCRSVSGAEALQRLLTTGSEVVQPVNSVSPLVALLRQAGCFEIEYGCSTSALTLVDATLNVGRMASHCLEQNVA